MTIELIAAGMLSSALMYGIGYKNGKKQGELDGFSNGMKRAEELALKKLMEERTNAKAFNGVKHRLPNPPVKEREIAWLG